MHLLRNISAIILIVLFHVTLNAQSHYNVWFRGTVSASVHPKIKLDAELQHRRQNGFDNLDMFNKRLLQSFRTWIHYQHDDKLRFSISPFAFFSNNGIIQQKEDERSLPNHEIRFTAAIELQKPLLDKLLYIVRPAIEYRWFRERNDKIGRLRNKLGLKYEISKKLNAVVYEELLLNVSGVSHEHFFDHNRLGIITEYKLNSTLKVELGYVYINRLPTRNDHLLFENNWIINVFIQIK